MTTVNIVTIVLTSKLSVAEKDSGGGLSIYIDNNWPSNNQVIQSHDDSNCELLTIKITFTLDAQRNQWLQRS